MKNLLTYLLFLVMMASAVIWTPSSFSIAETVSISNALDDHVLDPMADSLFLPHFKRVRGKKRVPFHSYHRELFVDFILPSIELPTIVIKYVVFRSQYTHRTLERPPSIS